MQTVKIAWNRFTLTPVSTDLAGQIGPEDAAWFRTKVESAPHLAVRLADDLFVEIPDPTWGGGDLLIYLPRRGWLVRRNYLDHWYIDMGIFRQFDEGLFGWTDLWLDLTAPEAATSYKLLDANEFAAALREGQVSAELAAYAMENLHRLVECFHTRQFPLPEVRRALAFAASLQPGAHDHWWEPILAIAGELERAAIPYALEAGTALYAHGVAVPVMDDIDIAVQWEYLERAHRLFAPWQPSPIAHHGGWAKFSFDRNGAPVDILSYQGSQMAADPDRVAVVREGRQVWAKSPAFFYRHTRPGQLRRALIERWQRSQ